MVLVGGGGGGKVGGVRSMYSAFLGNCSVSYLSFVYGRSLWAGLNGGENSLHWKANMLPLFSLITLCMKHIEVLLCTSEPSAQMTFSLYVFGGIKKMLKGFPSRRSPKPIRGEPIHPTELTCTWQLISCHIGVT